MKKALVRKILELVKSRDLADEQAFQLLKGLNRDDADNSVRSVPARDIAVIGISGRFPDAGDVEEFWRNLAAGRDSAREADRWDLESFYDPDPEVEDKSYCKWGAFLGGIEFFDPLFFNISPKEAELMDPQQRLFLEESWQALEDAGYADRALQGMKCAVFVGINFSDYRKLVDAAGLPLESYMFLGSSDAILSARLSYFLDLRGPGITVNTACSSSLAAVHLACETLRSGGAEMAVAGGVQVLATPEFHIGISKTRALSAEGRCRAFDRRANGFIPGEAVGVVVLKSLAAALQEGDHIYGVIVGSGMNQDGKTNGITAPSAPSQAALEYDLYRRFNIDPGIIGYVETHGTGTQLGDPIEIEALTLAFRNYTDKKQYCAVGSVKTNIGHTLAAAGIVSFIKVLLCLQHKALVPSLNFEQENELIDFRSSPFYVNTRLREWRSQPGKPRTAAVSSFGFSGTNVHLVVRELSPNEVNQKFCGGPGGGFSKKPPGRRRRSNPYYLVPVSAKTPEALSRKLKDLLEWLERSGKASPFRDIAYTLLVGRSQFSLSSVWIVRDLRELERGIGAVLGSNKSGEPGCLTGNLEEIGESMRSYPGLRQGGQKLIDELQDEALPGEEYRKKLTALAELYIQGVKLDWEKLYHDQGCRRISLPTYSFTKKRCWVPVGPGAVSRSVKTGYFHPLTGELAPWLSLERGVVYRRRFRPGDLIVGHHRVRGNPVLPAVGYLEMALAAASGLSNGGSTWRKLSGVYWLHPLEVPEAGIEVRTVIQPEGEVLAYEIRGMNGAGQPLLHSRGTIHPEQSLEPEPGAGMAIEEIKSRSTRQWDRETLHAYFQQMGIGYGPYFQGLVRVWGNSEEALGLLELPVPYEGELAEYTLHPTLADGALQTLLGIVNEPGPGQEGPVTVLPYSLESVEVLQPLSRRCYSYAVRAGKNRFHIFILDESGRVCIKLSDLAVRELNVPVPAEAQPGGLVSPLEAVVNQVNGSRSGEARIDENRQAYTQLEHFGQYLLLDAFRRMGVFPRAGERYELEELKQRTGIIPAYSRLLEALLEILEKASFIETRGRMVICRPELDLPQAREQLKGLEERKERLAAEYPLIEPHLELLWTCLRAYPEVLRGEKGHMEVMFPAGSRSLVERVYRENEESGGYNRIAAGIVCGYIQRWRQQDPQKPIKILEVGAGTGGTSAIVLEEIAAYHPGIRYFYTDISSGFTGYGREKFGAAYPFVEFKVLDLEKSPQDQGFASGNLDLVIATNVLHATRCMTATLGRLRDLLKEGGWLVINEITRLSGFATLTFGLTDGWWSFEDESCRLKGSPLLGTVQWRELLENGGFEQVRILGPASPGMKEGDLDQAVIAAEKAGSVSTVPLGDLREKTVEFVKGVFAKVLKMERASINRRSTFENYGVDSLVALDINKEFGKNFEKLPSTLLFEYNTIERLSDYFLEKHRGVVEQIAGLKPGPGVPPRQSGGFFKERPPAPERIKIEASPGPRQSSEDIAIIGVTGRYPLSPTLEDFWQNLQRGRNCTGEIPTDRWDWQKYYDPGPGGSDEGKAGYTRWGGFIAEVDKFDPLFFQISPIEAEGIDPQERLFLETAWTLLEDAAITPASLEQIKHRVGVFVGVMNRDYEWLGGAELAAGYVSRAYSSFSSIANRVSYFFNFQGPSLAVDTACSSSLTALHLACESLKRGECSLAVAGGVNLILHPAHLTMLCMSTMLSRGDRCKSFGAGADGAVVGEGVGAVLLKPLDKAVRDKNQIYAVIKGTAVNAGGKTGGYQVPNPNAQADMLRETLEKAKIDPATVNYIEAGAAGSALGDPIEIAGLANAFNSTRCNPGNQYCAIGSVKSNIGHLESASGMAGLTKVLLQMKYRQLVPSLHAEPPNPNIDFQDSPFYVQQELTEWKPMVLEENGVKKEFPRRAGVSSFGAGGANAHVLLEEYQAPPPDFCLRRPGGSFEKPPPGPPQNFLLGDNEESQQYLIVLSAKNEDRLRVYAHRLATYLASCERGDERGFLRRIAYTLQVGRTAMEERLAIVVSGFPELVEKLHRFGSRDSETDIEDGFQGNIKNRQASGEFLCREEEGQDLIREFIRKRKLSPLARLWVSGWEIDWQLLYPEQVPSPLSLPGYPFERKRCWIKQTPVPVETKDNVDADSQREIAGPANAGTAPGQDVETNPGVSLPEHFFFKPGWTRADLPPGPKEPAARKGNDRGKQTVLILYPPQDPGLGNALANAHNQDDVIKIKLGTRDRKISPHHLEINTKNPAALEDWLNEQKKIDSIYFLGGIIALEKEMDLYDSHRLDEYQERGVIQLFRLVKALSTQGFAASPLQLKVIINDVYQVEPGEKIIPYSASLSGLTRTMVNEFFSWKITCLDIGLKDLGSDTNPGRLPSLAAAILAEPPLQSVEEVALRQQKRYKRIFEPITLPPPGQNPFKQKGVYFILGGTGGIGLELGHYLAKTVQARLVLVDLAPPNARQQEKIAAIEAAGGEVLCLQANGTDLQDMSAAVQEAKARFGTLQGVIHSAIVLRDKTLQNMDEESLRAALAPKVKASLVLYQVVRHEPLDFMLFFSSGNALSCIPGQANYNAGCAFKDAFAQRLHQETPYPVQTINWGYWGTVGIVASQKYSRQFAAKGVQSITPAEGTEAVRRVLAHRTPQVMALKIEAHALEKMGINPSTSTHKLPDQDQPRENENSLNKAAIERKVGQCIAETLALEPTQVEKEKQFSEYGVNSLLGLKIVTKINETFGIVLRTTAIFDYANVKDLSRYILKRYGDTIAVQPPAAGLAVKTTSPKPHDNEDELLTLLRRLEKGECSARQVERMIK